MDWQFAFERSEMLRQIQASLLVSIGHELRSPLSSQMGALQMILTDLCDSPAEEREFVAAAKESVERQLQQITRFSEMVQHWPIHPLQIEATQLSTALETVFSLTQLPAQDRGIRYEWPVLSADLPWVQADPQGLQQALLGLCHWTIQQLRYGTISLTASEMPTRIRLLIEAKGRCRHPLIPSESLLWEVSHRLVSEMRGAVTLIESSEQTLGIEIDLSQVEAESL